jgi:hypothetical protein
MMLVKSFCNYYVLDKAVVNTNNAIIQKIAKKSSDTVQHQLALHNTCMKIAICWIESSTILSVAIGGILSPIASGSIGIIGLIPFVKPFLCLFSSHLFKSYQQLSAPEIVVCITAAALIVLVQYEILSKVFPNYSRHYTLLPFAISDISLNALLVTTAALIRRNAIPVKKSKSIQEIVADKHQHAQEKVIKYQALIQQIQNFIVKHPELQQLCEKYFIKDRENVAFVPSEVSEKPTNDIDAMTQLTIEGNNLEHMFNEFLEFLKRNQIVAEAFRKYIAMDHAAFKNFQQTINGDIRGVE